MMNGPRSWSDTRAEQILGALLRAGVIISVMTVLTGAVLYMMRQGARPVDYRNFRGEPADLRSLSGISHGAMDLRPLAGIQFGLVLLIATPVARVALSVVLFAAQRDRTYIVITSIVLAILIASIARQT